MINSNAGLESAFERLSTGKRINSAADDAAGLAIGKDLESRVSGLNQAIRNVNDGISMVQITEGALDEATTILQRMRDLSVQASNGSLSSTERGYLDTEHSKLATTLGTVIDQAKFNDKDLVNDSLSTTVAIQSGADAADITNIVVSAMTETSLAVDATLVDMQNAKEVARFNITNFGGAGATTLTLDGTTYTSGSITLTDADTAVGLLNAITGVSAIGSFAKVDANNLDFTFSSTADKTGTMNISSAGSSFAGSASTVTNGGYGIAQIDAALATVASERATLGATQAQLESTVRNLANVAENTSAAAGRIMDTDYAAETANLTKAQILQQAATSILAQANAQPQAVLSLLQ
jgi:flagellin